MTSQEHIICLMKRQTFHYYTYILYSLKDNKLYIGSTNDIKRRLTQHSNGQVDSTKHRLPLRLIHYEYFISKEDAEAREIFLKSGFGHDQLEQILKTTLKRVKD